LAEVAGSSIADAVTLTDSIVVIGGGLSGAWPLFLQALVDEMNNSFTELGGDTLPRMEVTAYNLEDEKDLKAFIADTSEEISIPFSGKTIPYDPVKKIGVGISRLGTSRAVAVGAYAYALNELSSV
jgi:glucokinase